MLHVGYQVRNVPTLCLLLKDAKLLPDDLQSADCECKINSENAR